VHFEFEATYVRSALCFFHGKNCKSGGGRHAAPYYPAWQQTTEDLFSNGDYAAYIDLMAQWCRKYGVDIWVYCLMPNHIHLIAVPGKKENLRLAIGEAHRRYTRRINFREGWRGHLWQERFSSFVMDERYLLACVGSHGSRGVGPREVPDMQRIMVYFAFWEWARTKATI